MQFRLLRLGLNFPISAARCRRDLRRRYPNTSALPKPAGKLPRRHPNLLLGHLLRAKAAATVRMIYTGIDTFYLTEEQLKSSPSRKDGIHEDTETTLRIYGCDLIQESGILLKLYPLPSFPMCVGSYFLFSYVWISFSCEYLNCSFRPQAVMATGQVLFHRFYCKKSFARFSVKRVSASCVWLASKLEECPKKAKHIIVVFHRMECRRENLAIEPFDFQSKASASKYTELKNDLVRTEGHLLKEMGFICHVEHPHKFISNYLATLDASPEMRQEAWNLANDSLRTTLCVRFKSEVVACGVVYAAARRFQVPLPESPPWWEVFDADKAGIDEVCRVLAHLYSLPKAQCIAVYKDNDSFTSRSKNPNQQAQVHKESPLNGEPKETSTPKSEAPTPDGSLPKETTVKAAQEKMEVNNSEGDTRNVHADVDTGGESTVTPNIDQKVDVDRNRDRDRERTRTRERDSRGRDSDYDGRSRDLDRDRERDKDLERERERRHHRAKDKDKGSGHSEKLRHHSSRDRSEYHSSRSSREKDRSEKDRHRHHPYS
ncbi:hypothetical protein ZIOFF_062435 [Zingiber officinale]|uniref:Cyclin-like domain-containing protein n=1 Tax=Zingiber officinale TaxID=94328 RepID=A0A8J5F0D1_ZINOF|nr:hypothetical protein ZIOFF_062435 [Zingiber officinale]